MATRNKIVDLYKKYMGFTPSSENISKFSMMSVADVEDVLKNTRSDVQSEAVETAQKNIADLSRDLPADVPPYAREYLESITKGRGEIEELYGLPQAEERTREAEEFYRQIAMRGPMFEEVMRTGLTQEVSPKFLGATRSDMEEYFAGIPNPFVKDRMVNSYLDASDRSLTASLNALNGLYQTALLSAETAMEMERSHYDRVAGLSKDLYSELQWLSRNRYEEKQTERMERAQLEREKELARYGAGLETPGITSPVSLGQLSQASPPEWYKKQLRKAYQKPYTSLDPKFIAEKWQEDKVGLLSPTARLVYEGEYRLDDLTDTTKDEIGPELLAVGWTRPKEPTFSQKKKVAEAQRKLNQVDELLSLLVIGEASTGPLSKWKMRSRNSIGLPRASENQIRAESLIQQMSAEKMFAVGGKRLPSQEIERLVDWIPEMAQQEHRNIENLRNLKRELESLYGQHFPSVEGETTIKGETTTTKLSDYLSNQGY